MSFTVDSRYAKLWMDEDDNRTNTAYYRKPYLFGHREDFDRSKTSR